ncbi:hypothetical protein SGLAD_v1c06010 [Spiroplasma gladiatoris]|uniref:Uncharacterized protein n=1 Tax=Spiroplasma gladiatoris TaxID=2143 RepID=A0A4P7AJS7_9MOLU|nr:hypothetical protein [Spiroplasma gladiatoris]QBQ07800.1 hypothetical protein SGLAD_v1c06010 [Spiroplasma gladiatoris]
MVLTELQNQLNQIKNTKNAIAYLSTLNKNLDLFSKNLQFYPVELLKEVFDEAWEENNKLFILNFLNYLDIRGGKGERRVSKRWLIF